MTAKKQTEIGAGKSKRLKLNKQTLRDLASRNDKADTVRGGAPQPTRGAVACTGSNHYSCGCGG